MSLSQTRIAIAICASTGIIAALLPWCQRPILESRYGTPYENPRVMYAEDAIASVEEDRWHVIVLYAISIIFALAEGIRKPLLGWTRLTAVAAAVLASFIVINALIMLERAISSWGEIDAAVALIILESAKDMGPRIFLAAGAGIALTISAFVIKDCPRP